MGIGGHAEAAELPLHGAEISTANKKGETLHSAVKSRSVEVVAPLLEKGAVTSADDWKGSTALHLAADGRHREIIDLLVDKPVELDAVDQLGRAPLHQFAWLEYGATTKLIVDKRGIGRCGGQ